MADEKEKKADGLQPKEFWRYVKLTAAIAVFALLTYMKLSDSGLLIFGGIFGCFSLGFSIVAATLAIKLATVLTKNKEQFKYDYGILMAAVILSVICAINSAAEDIKRTNFRDACVLENGVTLYLCEYSETDDLTDIKHTYLTVYHTTGRVVKKLGTIDETGFGYGCLEEKAYSYSFDKSTNVLTLVLNANEESLIYAIET